MNQRISTSKNNGKLNALLFYVKFQKKKKKLENLQEQSIIVYHQWESRETK